MKIILVSLMLLLSGVVSAQTVLDPTQGGAYPRFSYTLGSPGYLDHSCGGVSQSQYGERVNADNTVTGAFRFFTSCSTGGRGSVPRRFESCWEVTFDTDRYTVLVRDLVLYATWKMHQPAIPCPAF